MRTLASASFLVFVTLTLTSHASSLLWRNIAWIHPVGWAIGVGVDLGTGAGYELAPRTVAVPLVPDGSRPQVSE